MTAKSAKTPKRETMNFRIKAEDRGLIDRAAAMTGKSRTDFLLEAGRRAAEDALLDRTLIQAGPDAVRLFIDRLEAPPGANDKLRRTLNTPPPWA